MMRILMPLVSATQCLLQALLNIINFTLQICRLTVSWQLPQQVTGKVDAPFRGWPPGLSKPHVAVQLLHAM
jgi:hypothetical protein